MATKTIRRRLSFKMLIRVAYAAISLNGIPYAKGAETARPDHHGQCYTVMAGGQINLVRTAA